MHLVDTHAHLDFEQFDEDREDVVSRCQQRLDAVVNPGTNLETSEAALALSEEYPGFLHAAAGVHPTAAVEHGEETITAVAALIREEINRLVAVGEIGLDYYHVRGEEKREEQKDVFHQFLSVAEDVNLPVIIHSRDAEPDTVSIIEAYDVTGVLHCFNGTPDLAEQAVDNEFLIGVSTQVLYSSRVRTLVNQTGLDHIVLETDAPFLYRGERNHPVNIAQSVQEISDILNVPVKQVGKRTTANALNLFPALQDVVEVST